jgi:hypothetical protein
MLGNHYRLLRDIGVDVSQLEELFKAILALKYAWEAKEA